MITVVGNPSDFQLLQDCFKTHVTIIVDQYIVDHVEFFSKIFFIFIKLQQFSLERQNLLENSPDFQKYCISHLN